MVVTAICLRQALRARSGRRQCPNMRKVRERLYLVLAFGLADTQQRLFGVLPERV